MRTRYRFCRTCNATHDLAAWPHPEAAEAKFDASAGYDERLQGKRSGTFRKCTTCGGFHEVDRWPHNCMPEDLGLRSELASPMVVSDSLETMAGSLNGMKSFADGRHYTSKAKYRADLRARGYVEVGNDPARLRPSKKVRADRKKIKAAVERTASRLGWGA